MFDTVKCNSCGAENKKTNKFCSSCGQMLSGVVCGSCGKPLRAGATFCSNCGAKVQPPGTPGSTPFENYIEPGKTNIWQRGPGDLARRFEVDNLNTYLGIFKKITVVQGTKALFLQGGRYMGELPPGTYDSGGGILDFVKTLNLFERSIIILVDDGDIPLEIAIGGLRTQENFDAGVKGKMVIRIEKPILLHDNFMKSRPQLTVNDIETLVRDELRNVLQSKIKQHSFEDLYGNLDLKKEIEQDFEYNLGTTLSRVGLQLIHLPYFDYNEDYWADIIRSRGDSARDLIAKREKIRNEANLGLVDYEQKVAKTVKEHEISIAEEKVDKDRETLERKRFDEITKLMRERLTDDKMNQFQNAEELEKYLHEIDRNKVFRENDLTDFKRFFNENREDRSVARRLMFERLEQRHKLDMKGEVLDEDIRGRKAISEEDIREAGAGIDLLAKMKATKREDVAGYQALDLEKQQKQAEIEAQRLKARSAASDEAQIAMAEGKQADYLTEITKMKAAKGLTEEQLMAIAAKDNAAVAAALKEKYGAQKAAEMMEQRLRDQQAFVDRMQQMEDRTMDRMERISGKSLEQMGYTAATRATPERSGTGTTVVAPGFGAPVVVTPGGASAPQPPQTPPKKVVICPRCNAELDPSEKFCNSCGAKVQ